MCAAAIAALGLSGCGNQIAAPIDFRGSNPDATTVSPSPTPDNRGVVKIDNYDAVVARRGDTLESIAARLQISASELAAYNGYPSGYSPSEGDILVLPPRPGGYGAVPERRVAAASTAPASAASAAPATGERWSPAIAAAAIERGTESPAPTPSAASVPMESGEGTESLFAPLAEPLEPPPSSAPAETTRYHPTGSEITHIASAGETMYSIANRYSLTVGELSYANGLQAGSVITPGQVLIIPQLAGYASTPPATAPMQEERPDDVVIAPPEDEPIVVATAPAAVQTPAAQAPAPADTGAKFLAPVSGPIVESFSVKRGGVEFGAAVGSPVRAAESGTVVLVSKSLGGLGVIILIRHDPEYMTVYGRVDEHSISKGQKVERGQVIASVAPPSAGKDATLHFEIRRGTVSIDPEPLL